MGVAGARGIAPRALVIGSEAVYSDLAAGVPVVERARPDPGLVAAARGALPEAAALPIGTSARVGGTRDVAVEAMAGFAVLRAAELAGVPRSRCAPSRTRSASRIAGGGATQRRWPPSRERYRV